MLTVLSPAKRLDPSPPPAKLPPSLPQFQADAVSLARSAGRQGVAGLQKLMSISENLARLNQGRFRAFDPDPETEAAKPAVLTFAGDTYAGLEAASLDADELAYAQDHLRILSGLYGLLRPLDRIQPHRLEMGSRLSTRRGRNLYAYWGSRLAEALNAAAGACGARVLVNCASVEYFSAVDRAALRLPVVTPVFLEMRAGEAKIVSFFAKKARGAMARFIIQHRITDPAGLEDFDTGGYRHQPGMSEPGRPVFLRDRDSP